MSFCHQNSGFLQKSETFKNWKTKRICRRKSIFSIKKHFFHVEWIFLEFAGGKYAVVGRPSCSDLCWNKRDSDISLKVLLIQIRNVFPPKKVASTCLNSNEFYLARYLKRSLSKLLLWFSNPCLVEMVSISIWMKQRKDFRDQDFDSPWGRVVHLIFRRTFPIVAGIRCYPSKFRSKLFFKTISSLEKDVSTRPPHWKSFMVVQKVRFLWLHFILQLRSKNTDTNFFFWFPFKISSSNCWPVSLHSLLVYFDCTHQKHKLSFMKFSKFIPTLKAETVQKQSRVKFLQALVLHCETSVVYQQRFPVIVTLQSIFS